MNLSTYNPLRAGITPMNPLLSKSRQRGILTKEDRQYLFGELDASELSDPKNAFKQRRYRIRQRLEHNLLDLVLINTLLSERDQMRVFELILESTHEDQFDHILSEIINLLYANTPVTHSKAITTLGVEKAYHRKGISISRFHQRPQLELNITDRLEPEDLKTEIDIRRYRADLERLIETEPPTINTAPPDPDSAVYAESTSESRLNSLGLEQDLQYEQAKDVVHELRIAYLRALGRATTFQ